MAGGEGRATGIALWIGGVCSVVTTILLTAQGPVAPDPSGNQHLALAGVYLVPFGLAAGARFRRRTPLLAAAVVGAALSPMLWSGLPLLLVPAVGYVMAFARTAPSRLPRWRAVPAVAVPVLLTFSALVLVFRETTERCAPAGYGCADVPDDRQLVAAVVLAFAAVVLGWVLARPQVTGGISPRNPHVVGLVPHRPTQAE